MKKVLIVDDDESFLHSLIDGFKAYEDQFSIAMAGNGLEAIDVLKEQDISLVLTDLKMPEMDGFQLVAHLSSNYSDMPIIVMTAFGTPEMQENLREMGTFQYIEKPIDFDILVGKIIKELKKPSGGYITGVSLSSFLQLLELDKKNCTLTIHAADKEGIMYFRDGDLLDAKTQDIQGSEAAFTIVSWTNVSIEIENSCSVTEKNIKETLGFILLEGSRRKDENSATTSQGGVSDSTGLGSLDSLNLEDLDLDLSTDLEPSPALSEVAQEATDTAIDPAIAQLTTMLTSFPEITSSTISSKDGDILHQAGAADSNTANFITYVAVAAEQIQIALGATGRQYSFFTMDNNAKLLVLCGQDIIVGLSLDGSALPEPIADGLRPVLSRIKLQK